MISLIVFKNTFEAKSYPMSLFLLLCYCCFMGLIYIWKLWELEKRLAHFFYEHACDTYYE